MDGEIYKIIIQNEIFKKFVGPNYMQYNYIKSRREHPELFDRYLKFSAPCAELSSLI